MLHRRVRIIIPRTVGIPGVTAMTSMPAAATPAAEHEEQEQSPQEQPDQPSSHQRAHPLSHRLSVFFPDRSGCISHASSLIVLILQQYRTVLRPMDFLPRQEIQHFLRSYEEYSPVFRCTIPGQRSFCAGIPLCVESPIRIAPSICMKPM